MRAVVLAAVLLSAARVEAADPSPSDLGWLRAEAGDGALGYMLRDAKEIYLTELATGDTVFVADGTHPEFSPDSSKLAWVDSNGSTIKGRMRKGDTTVHTITTGASIDGGVHWIANDEVVVLKSGSWYRVTLSGEQQRVDALNTLGGGEGECDVKLVAGVWYYVDSTGWATSAGDTGAINGTCSSSLRADGRRTTGLIHAHKICNLTAVPGDTIADTLEWVYDFTGEKGFDNHRYSSNDNRFVTVQDEKYNVMVVMKVGDTYGTRMGNSGSGEMYGDFTVGDGSGDPWPGTAVEPVLQLDRTSVSFAALASGADPSPKDVAVSNAGEGTLDAVSTTVSYGSGSGWLEVTRSGAGNTQVLTNGISVAGLGAGTYDAQVSVSAANASNSPRSYTVALVVSTAPALATIEVVTAAASVEAGGNVDVTATAFDQNGDGFATDFVWSVSGGGEMTPGSSPGPVSAHTSTFTSGGPLGTFTVRATSGTMEGSADIRVLQPGVVHIKANCGGGDVSGWEDGAIYAQGGVDFDFGASFDTSGVADAAPAAVYETCRHRIRDVESEYSYAFAVADGSYLVRLHFGDGTGPRSIDVWIEGTEVISDLDPATAAGGSFRALVRDVSVTVDDGDGLQITLTDDRVTPADFFVNGIEVVSTSGNQAPLVDAGLDQSAQLGAPVFLIGTASDDGAPAGSLTTDWSLVDGPGTIVFDDAAALETQVSIDVAGVYLLRLTADDGELQVSDDLVVTVTEPPSITILSPVSGDLLEPGSAHRITWTTVNLDDVQIDYSSDGGISWENLAGSVDTGHADWGAFPWQVPELESSDCLVRVTGYFGEAPTLSGVFAIGVVASESDESDSGLVASGCRQSGSSFAALVAALWLLWRRRR